MASRREGIKVDKIQNCCKNCIHAENYTGYDDFNCIQLDHMIRAEKFECDHFKPKKMSKTKCENDMNQTNTESIMKKVDNISDTIKEISDKLVNKYCKDLDDLMSIIREQLQDKGEITDTELEFLIMDLANILYFTGSAQEDLGIKEDTCKAIRQEVYSFYRNEATGTVADKTALAELACQKETMTLAIYSRAYKKVKLRMDAGYEMLNSLKKVMNKRITEMELSNSRYINHSDNEVN